MFEKLGEKVGRHSSSIPLLLLLSVDTLANLVGQPMEVAGRQILHSNEWLGCFDSRQFDHPEIDGWHV